MSSGVWRSPGGGKWQPTPVSLPEKSHGQRSLAGYSPRGHKVGHNWATKNVAALGSLGLTDTRYYILGKINSTDLLYNTGNRIQHRIISYSGKNLKTNRRRKSRRFHPWVGKIPGGRHGTHSSLPAWRVPWAEEPGGLQSMGSQRVGHDWATQLNWTEFMQF